MPSSIPGYEYDIFISYRQKDNTYDGWVTAFIENLRKELEATIKHPVYMYTDENKYDGIQEIHHVEESISSKLKCLIFIPIISQTYCDPNCYAWKNEFLIFKKLASEDALGLKIQLPNGNVTSRIVPVRIHELDKEDQIVLESELGPPLRSIDFIFKAPGVNRPLSATEDHPADNQNKLFYRDQINKVANLIKEIMLSVKQVDRWNGIEELQKPIVQSQKKPPTSTRKIVGVLASVALVFAVLNYFLGRDALNTSVTKEKISIAVLPFNSIGAESESQYFADGVMEVLLSNLTFFPELNVKSRASVERFRNESRSVAEMADELDVSYILSGSAQKYGDDIRIVVQLVDASKDVNVWSENYVRKLSNIFDVQNQISEAVASQLKAQLTPGIANQIKRSPTSNFEAYDLYLRARQLSRKYETSFDPQDLKEAIHLLEQCVEMDSQFALGFAWLAGLRAIEAGETVADPVVRNSILTLANKALNLDSTVVEANLVLSQLYNYELDNVNTLRYSYKALVANTLDSLTAIDLVKRLAAVYSRIGDVDKAIYLYDQLYSLSPNNAEALELKFIPLAAGHYVESLEKLSQQIKTLNPDNIFADVIMAHVFTEKGDRSELAKMYTQLKASGRLLTLDEWDQYAFVLAEALRRNGQQAEASDWLKQVKRQISIDDLYLQSQYSLLMGNREEALQMIREVSIGWYNINVCMINPIFDAVRSESQFTDFIKRNTDRVTNERIRINELERNGYLPLPENFFEGKNKNYGSWL